MWTASSGPREGPTGLGWGAQWPGNQEAAQSGPGPAPSASFWGPPRAWLGSGQGLCLSVINSTATPSSPLGFHPEPVFPSVKWVLQRLPSTAGGGPERGRCGCPPLAAEPELLRLCSPAPARWAHLCPPGRTQTGVPTPTLCPHGPHLSATPRLGVPTVASLAASAGGEPLTCGFWDAPVWGFDPALESLPGRRVTCSGTWG